MKFPVWFRDAYECLDKGASARQGVWLPSVMLRHTCDVLLLPAR